MRIDSTIIGKGTFEIGQQDVQDLRDIEAIYQRALNRTVRRITCDSTGRVDENWLKQSQSFKDYFSKICAIGQILIHDHVSESSGIQSLNCYYDENGKFERLEPAGNEIAKITLCSGINSHKEFVPQRYIRDGKTFNSFEEMIKEICP
jgi:hypothetical protein